MNDLILTAFAFIASYFFIAYASVLAHELGHALAGKWIGLDVTSFGTGVAVPIIVFTCRGTIVYICLKNSHVGLTSAFPPLSPPSKFQRATYIAAGGVVQLLLCIIGATCWLTIPWGRPFWAPLAIVNFISVLAALSPSNEKQTWLPVVEPDGRRLWQLFGWQQRELGTGLQSILILHNLRGLWQAIGDHRMEAYAVHGAAGEWRFLGVEKWAEELSREFPAPTTEVEAEVFALGEQARNGRDSGNFEAAANALNKARSLAAAHGDLAVETTVVVQKAYLAFAMGQVKEAWELLTDWGKQSWIIERPAARALWLVYLVYLPSDALTNEMLIDWDQDYCALQAQGTPLTIDWKFYQKITELYVARGLAEQTVTASRNAMKAAVEISKILPTPEDQSRFVEHVTPFQKQTSDFLHLQSKPTAAEEVLLAYSYEEKLREESAIQAKAEEEKKTARERKLLRWGLVLAAVNTTVFVGAGWVGRVIAADTNSIPTLGVCLISLALLLGMFLFGTILYLALYSITRWLKIHRRETPGSAILVLGSLPWAILGMVGIAAILVQSL